VYVLWRDLPAGHVYLVARGAGGRAPALAVGVRAAIREAAPSLPAMPFRTLDDFVEASVADRRLRAMLGSAVALLALAVAMVGLAGALTRAVSERRQELAIRAALGATPARTLRTVVSEGVLLCALGIVFGLGGALAAGRAIRSLLHGVGPYDPLTLASVAALVAVISLAASVGPARRAARIDPLALLRAE
jgi:ABC-type antimicrobial peptide transport system permease subunit